MTKFIVIVLGLGFLAHSALAMGEKAVEVDSNGDGMMTIDEVQSVFPDVTAEAFAEADTNDDGALDDAEMVAGQDEGLLPAATGG